MKKKKQNYYEIFNLKNHKSCKKFARSEAEANLYFQKQKMQKNKIRGIRNFNNFKFAIHVTTA